MFLTENTILLVIDIQGKLAQVVKDTKLLHQNVSQLISAFTILDIPIIITEQAPEKLGSTTPELIKNLSNPTIIEKTSFSCFGELNFVNELSSLKRTQVVVCGVESHVCVIQTVRDLINSKYNVQVVSDAIASRKPTDRWCALSRIEKLGTDITTVEMIITELLQTSKHPKFKEVMKLIK